MSDDTAYYRADVQGLNPGDATRHPDFAVYRVTLDEPTEPDPDAAEDHLGEVFVRSPWGAVVDVVDND
jgi:hypothetical protein